MAYLDESGLAKQIQFIKGYIQSNTNNNGGDADTLGGKNASEYALKTDVSAITGEQLKDYATKSELSQIPKFNFSVVNSLSEVEDISESTIYIVPSTDISENNIYAEYIYVNNKWEKLGEQSSDIDLAGYMPKTGGEFTGTVTAPTPTAGDDSTKLATTEFVNTKASNYLPLSGGTITGNIYTSASRALARPDNVGTLNVLGGSDGAVASGAKLILIGGSATSNAGQFTIHAGSDSGSVDLIGRPNGTLTWGGNSIALTKDVLPLAGGTLTGDVTINDNRSIYTKYGHSSTIGIIGGSTDSGLGLLSKIGSFYDTNLILRASDQTSDPRFALTAGDGTTSKSLVGKPDGSLTWDGNAIALAKDYLPLSGGTIIGAITTTVSDFAKRSNDAAYLRLMGGTARENGASITLIGKDHSTQPGQFTLRARDASSQKDLTGHPDGTLTWDGKNIITSTDLATGNYYTKLQNVFFGNGNQNYYPYHRIATTGIITGGYQTYTLELLVNAGWVSSGTGIVKITVRTNASGSLSSVSTLWVERTNNMPIDTIMLGFRNVSGDTICDVFGKTIAPWNNFNVKVLVNGDPRDNTATTRFTLFNSEEVNDTTASDKKTSTNSYSSIANANTELYTDKPYTSEVIPTDNTLAGGMNFRWNHNTTDSWIPVKNNDYIDYITKDEIISPCLKLTGGTVTGDIVMNGTADTNYLQLPSGIKLY